MHTPNKSAPRFLYPSAAVEAAIKPLDLVVSQGSTIPWSTDYFKYRIIAAQVAPFSFSDIMQEAEGAFDESPPYEEIKDLIFELLGNGKTSPILRQCFDLQEVKELDAEGKETTTFEGRKEIVFEPLL